MKESIQEITTLLDEDLVLLERQTRLIARLSRALATDDMDALRLIRRELDDVGETSRTLDARRTSIRERLSTPLGAEPCQVRVSLVLPHADEADRLALEDRRERLSVAVDAVNTARIAASVVLYEKARLNRAIVAALFPETTAHSSYSSDGRARAPEIPSILEVET